MSNEEKMIEELTKIKELLTPKPVPVPKNFREDFKAFLKKYKVFGMAIAFIMGIYVGNVINAVVDDLIMPLIEYGLPADLAWEEWMLGPFRMGHFLGTILTFFIVALVIFLLVKLFAKWEKLSN
ncbi:MscL family protein [Promethearchaeum syntrophicum]|uniref:MscL family protein n=1 Tax=Promethearchaeum syntrophicum TaxID=2594042 RepID=A0A5B9D674_9ARCH|nr:MscL family protein [Candidatus Prometheoarchaeum syntrophicum]QEE14638.1 large-conductance mechanosensitive channel [Candidatus Prometheoarchaeum syntrophicum]